MKALTARNTTPVTQKVIEIVSSMAPQFEAMGVKYQGLRKWNSTEPRASTMSARAIPILRLRGGAVEPPVQHARHAAEHHVGGQRRAADQVGEPWQEVDPHEVEVDQVQQVAEDGPRGDRVGRA